MRNPLVIFLIIIVIIACRERYGLPMEAARENALVVEGNILSGDTNVIHLSRSSAIAERRLAPETGATLSIEGNDNSIYHYFETEPGVYKTEFLTLNPSVSYRLKIGAAGKEYESDWLPMMNTPDIDSVMWRRDNDVEIFVASHGGAEDARYYKWDYDEVWEFYSKYRSKAYFTYVITDNGTKRYQCIDKTSNGLSYSTCVESYDVAGNIWNDSMYHCWKYDNSSNINIGSTAALSDNVVFAPVRKFEEDSWELSYLYSINVKQTGLSKDAYEFYKILKANSEGLGSIFDAQPSELKTNLRCITDASETVVGFIDATTVKSKRIFISKADLPGWTYEPFSCADTLVGGNNPKSVEESVAQNLVPVEVLQFERQPPFRVSSYSLSHLPCVDCRIRGVHKRPEFWPR